MIRIILCEGETDATLLGYYLERMAGWWYNAKPNFLRLRFSPQENKCFLAYKNVQGEELFICGVGGKDGFENFLNEYLYDVIWMSHQGEKEFRIAVVTDRDDVEMSEIEKDITEQFSKLQCLVKDNHWKSCTFANSFEQICTIDFLLVVIPQEKEGALENLLMDSLSENEYDANVVYRCKNFVMETLPEIERYVSTGRLKIKAQLGVVLSVVNPERIFRLFNEYIESVPWEKSKILKECFGKLIEI